jgi:hypothetical protein
MLGRYTGRKLRAELSDTAYIPADAGTWDAGSRDIYEGLEMATGRVVSLVDTMSAPWDSSRRDQTITLRPGFCVVRHSTFRGKDMGLTFIMRPSDAAPMLPAPVTLTDLDRCILAYTAGRKASYAGLDRYGMAQQDHANSWATPLHTVDPFPARAAWDEAKATLIGRGLLNGAGAITPAGRNAIGGGLL